MSTIKDIRRAAVPYLLLILAVSFWSGNFIVGRAVRGDIPPFALAFWRWAVASLLIGAPALASLKQDWALIRRHWPILMLLAATGVAAFNTLVYTGLQYTVAINAFLLQAMMPLLIVVFSYLLFRTPVHQRLAWGTMLCLAGAVTIIVRGDPAVIAALSFNPGDLLVFLAVAAYAAYSVLLRKRPPIHPLSFVAVTFALGTLMLLPLYLWETYTVRPISLNRVTLVSIAYVGIFPSIISYLCYNRGVERLGATRAGLFLYLMPIFGSALAVFFLGESFHWFHWAGLLFIVAGLATTLRAENA
jgi:drug/metabolite transporter (DMT)-like permease